MSLSPAVRRRQQQLARWVRRAPGARFAVQEVLPRIRRNAVLTDLAWRVFAPRHGAGNVEVALLPDRHVRGPDVGLLPVVGVLATGLSDEQALALLDHVAELQEQTQAFRPVFLLDRPVFAAARAHGYVVEHLVPEATWASGGHTADPGARDGWVDYVAARLGSVTDHYQLWHLARVRPPAEAGDGIPRLERVDEALLRALPERLAAVAQARQDAAQP